MELPVQFVLLGSGDAAYEDFFRHAAERWPERMAIRLGL